MTAVDGLADYIILLVLDADSMTVTHCSENADLFFKAEASILLGQSLAQIFEREIVHSLNNLLSVSVSKDRRVPVQRHKVGNDWFQIYLHRKPTAVFIEIERLPDLETNIKHLIQDTQNLLMILDVSDDINLQLNKAVIGLRRLTGFERFVCLRRDENNDFTIAAQSCGPHLGAINVGALSLKPYLNQSVKASHGYNIPFCEDLNKTQTRLLTGTFCAEIDQPEIDVSTCLASGYSIFTRSYLRETAVEATVSFPLIVSDRLWGWFEGHHMSPRPADPNLREALQLFGTILSLRIEK